MESVGVDGVVGVDRGVGELMELIELMKLMKLISLIQLMSLGVEERFGLHLISEELLRFPGRGPTILMEPP